MLSSSTLLSLSTFSTALLFIFSYTAISSAIFSCVFRAAKLPVFPTAFSVAPRMSFMKGRLTFLLLMTRTGLLACPFLGVLSGRFLRLPRDCLSASMRWIFWKRCSYSVKPDYYLISPPILTFTFLLGYSRILLRKTFRSLA